MDAYCGAPPSPAELLSRWQLDPVLLGVLLGLLLTFLVAARRGGWLSTQRTLLFVLGWTIGTLALVSPLCAWSVSLFSARIAQHMILALIAAPLLALAHPVSALRSLLERPLLPRRASGHQGTVCAAALFALAIWYWHAPAPYAATFHSDIVYWMMHISIIASSIWLWDALLNGEPDLTRAGVSALSMMQMSLLGALLVFAPQALFAPHFATTEVWNLSPLEDQQIGGVIMWVPGGFAFFVLSMAGVWRTLEGKAISAAT